MILTREKITRKNDVCGNQGMKAQRVENMRPTLLNAAAFAFFPHQEGIYVVSRIRNAQRSGKTHI